MPTVDRIKPIFAGVTPYPCCKASKAKEILENCIAAKMPHNQSTNMRGQWVDGVSSMGQAGSKYYRLPAKALH